MRRTFGCCRYVWNRYLAKRKEAYISSGETLNHVACANDMTQLKHEIE
ncbi:MAG: helix-turn-helix domain-containing protein [Treponema sp.]|nr:helix-turn-helix domain-containing protein [Treponema sp.]